MYEQVKLNYSFDALEPYVDTLTMETHYGKHHATYTKTLNEAAEKAGVSDKPIEEVLSNLDSIADETLRKMVRNNGGGYYNHNLYFSTMSPNPQKEPDDNLKAQIEKDFGGFDEVKDLLDEDGWKMINDFITLQSSKYKIHIFLSSNDVTDLDVKQVEFKMSFDLSSKEQSEKKIITNSCSYNQ